MIEIEEEVVVVIADLIAIVVMIVGVAEEVVEEVIEVIEGLEIVMDHQKMKKMMQAHGNALDPLVAPIAILDVMGTVMLANMVIAILDVMETAMLVNLVIAILGDMEAEDLVEDIKVIHLHLAKDPN